MPMLDPVEPMGYTNYISQEGVFGMRTKLFLSNRSQAVRLPKAIAFPGTVTEVAIVRDGIRRIIVPADATWDDFFEAAGVDLGPRTQPAHQQREPF